MTETNYAETLTVAVPVDLIAAGNALSQCLVGMADGERTFGAAWLQDAAGNCYAAASAHRTLWDAAFEPLALPEDDDGTVDLALAQAAQAVVVLCDVTTGAAPPLAQQGVITAIIGMDGMAALAAMGLSAVEVDL